MAHLRASDSDVELSGSGASSAGSLSDEGARPRQRKRQRSSLKRGELSAARRRQTSLAEAGPSATDTVGNHARYVPWTKEEDDRLRQLVEQLGPKNWSNIAAQMNNRTSKSCRLRWLNQLRPNVQTGGFTPEEDLVIMDAQAKLGNKWTAIAAMLPGRTDNAVKNRWNSALRKRLEGAVGAPPELMQQDAREQNVKREQTPSLQHAQAQAQQQQQAQAQAQQQQQEQAQAQQQQDEQQQIMEQQQQEQQQAKQQQALFSQLFAGHPHDPSTGAWNQGLDAGRQAMMSGARPLPTPPPSSTALVATAPPFQLPLPFMTLQSQMSASEAAAMLAAANCDMLKKVSEAAPLISATATVTSTAMVALAPPPAMMSMSSAGAAEQGQALQQAPQSQDPSAAPPQQHQPQSAQQQQSQPQLNNPSLSTMRRVMSTHLAVKLLQQQQQHAPPPATMAMVACTPPPAVMTIPVPDAKAAGAQPPAVSWQLPADLTRADSLPTVDLIGVPFMGHQAGSSQPSAGGKDVSVKEEPRDDAWQAAANRPPTAQQQQPAVQPQLAAPGLAHQLLMLQQQVLQRQQQQAQVQQQSQQQQAQQQQAQQQAQAQQQQQAQHQAQVQQQQQQILQQAPPQLQQAQAAPQDQQAQAAMMQQLAWQLQGSSTPAAHRQSDPTAPAPSNRPPSTDTGVAATSMAAPPMHVHSITASASASGLGTGAGGSGGSPASASKLLAGLLESSATRSAVPSSLVRVVAAGGAEAVEHLLALGWGTLTAAAALRQQTHSSNTLSMAQMQTASHPSADALLQWTGVHSHGGMHGGHSHDAHGSMHASASHATGTSAHDVQHPMLPPPMQHQGVPDLGPCLGSIIQQAQQHHQQQQQHRHHQPSLLIDGSPLGSMSDLMALCDPGTLVDLERVAGSLSLARHPHQPEGATVDDAGGMHATQHEPDSPASLEQLLGSDNALHRFMQQPEGASSPNLTHLLEGFGDGADIVMHCATHG